MSSPVIEVRSISKSYGPRRALDEVSLEVEAGQIVSLLGPNGSGKTTLFRILATLLSVDAGSVRIAGADPLDSPMAVRRLIGVVFQSASLDKKLTVAENLKHHGHMYGMRGQDLQRRLDAVLESVSLTERAGDLVETLSGGLARRAEIAKSILPSPQVLLLDEPSTGLDPTARRDLWRHLDALRNSHGVSILMTTHILDEADRCDRVVILDQGRVVANATPSEIKAEVGGDVIHVDADDTAAVRETIRSSFSMDAAIIDGRVRIESSDGASLIPKLAATLGESATSMTLGHPTLEDAFIHITGHAFREANEA